MTWHTTPLAQQLIADMHALDAMSNRYLALARGTDGAFASDDTADLIGVIEQGIRPAWLGGVQHKVVASGIVNELLFRLDTLRDDAIDAEWLVTLKRRGIREETDEADAAHDEVMSAIPSVTDAITAWVRSHQKKAA